MLFETLDNKEECVGVYCNNELHFDAIPDDLTHTWNYSAFLRDRTNVEYAFLYAQKALEDACPVHLAQEWETINGRMKAFLCAFTAAKIDLTENCFFDLVNECFLREYCEMKNKITEHVFKTHEKPENYDFLVDLTKVLHDMKHRKIQIDPWALRDIMHQKRARNFTQKLSQISLSCDYNIFGTKTGRLTTKKNSFPVLTMDKKFRKVVTPTNDWFVSLDFNGAELRTFLALSDMEQPDFDVHDWNRKNVYKSTLTREDAKERFFAWLYNPKSQDLMSERAYNKDAVMEKHWWNGAITNAFGRTIAADAHHAMSYLIQSTCSDVVLRQMIKLDRYLSDKASFVAFCVHDEVVLDMENSECSSLVNVLVEHFSNTALGKFGVNVKYGKSYGDMREWKQ
tara:strand:- start:1625 stop:2815 length:1191 start_codon:yes stop_codon:yes gene_type:complete